MNWNIFNRKPEPAANIPPAPSVASISQTPGGNISTVLKGANVTTPPPEPTGGTPKRKRPETLSEIVAVPAGIHTRLVALAGPGLVKPDEIEAFRNAQQVYDRITGFIRDHLPARADEAWQRQQQEVRETVATGQRERVPQDGWSREEWRDDFYMKRKALDGRIREANTELIPTLLEISERIGVIAKKCADEIEAEEKSFAEEWGQSWQPSKVYSMLRYIEKYPHQLVGESTSNPPRLFLQFAGINL